MTEETRKKLMDAVVRLNAAHRRRAELLEDSTLDSDIRFNECEEQIQAINQELWEILK